MLPNRLLATVFVLATSAPAAPTFIFEPAPGTPQEVIDGFVEAGNLWRTFLGDSVTVNIEIGVESLGPGILGGTLSTLFGTEYANVGLALLQDITSQDDLTAVLNLPNFESIPLLLNRTADNPNGPGSSVPYLDNDGTALNTSVFFTSANAKAMGFSIPSDIVDAEIMFSSDFPFDFDRSDGIDSAQIDFVGMAAHEIGHALGFTSGVDLIDCFDGAGPGPCLSDGSPGPFPSDAFAIEVLDLFRFSEESSTLGALDYTADTRPKYFSIDGGTTRLAYFSTGVFNGDGGQASHWVDNAGFGIMDPTLRFGELDAFGRADLRAIDVIGWHIVPEPSTYVLMAAGLGLILTAARWRRT